MPESKLSQEGAKMLTGFEAMILHTYPDSGGVETVCIGHVVKPEDQVWLRDGVTRDECLQVLGRDVHKFETAIDELVTVPLSQPMVDALVSLVFNIGVAGFQHSSVLTYLNQGKYSDAADAFTLWRYAKVKQKDGSYQKRPILLGRREAEARLFRSGIAQAMGMAQWSEPPSLEVLLAKAQAMEFSLFELLPEHPPIEPEPSDPVFTEDGRLVALPPDEEEQAA